MSKEVLDKQVGEWRKEVARLKDLIAHATGTKVAANKAAEEGGPTDAELAQEVLLEDLEAIANYWGGTKVEGYQSDEIDVGNYLREKFAALKFPAIEADRASRQVPGPQELLAELAEAADVFMKGGVAPLRQKIDQAKLFCAGITEGSASRQVANKAEVGCERDDGLLNIHPEHEFCEVCTPPATTGASTVLTDERNQFEAYVRKECDSEEYADSILEKNSGGFYHTVRIQGAWEGWQARSKVAAQAGQVAVPKVAWTDPAPGNKDCPYDHVTAQTGFGQIQITWKSWKDYPGYAVDMHPVPDFFECYDSLEEAKQGAEKAYFDAISSPAKESK